MSLTPSLFLRVTKLIGCGLVLMASAMGQPADQPDHGRPIDLRCEHVATPLGLDEMHPRFSWRLITAKDSLEQKAFRVLVASSPEILARDKGDLWDSGQVSSPTSANVVYAGKALASRQQCWWKVQVWNERGIPSGFSAPAQFEMALLSPDDWQAEWIGGPPSWPGRALYFRSSFKLSVPPRRARLYVAGLGFYESYINGVKQGEGVLEPSVSDTSKRVYYRTFDALPALRVGENVLGAIVGLGWQGTHMLRAQLEVECADGSRVLVATGRRQDLSAWGVAPGPIVGDSIYDGEDYDARLSKPGWDRPGYSTAKVEGRTEQWDGVFLGRGPGGKMQAAPLEEIRVMRELPARSVEEPKPGVFVFDFGQNHAGWVRLRVRGPQGTKVTMRYAESLKPEGTVDQENLKRLLAMDTYILDGSGEETWSPRFTYHGYRYVQVEGWPGRPALQDLTACVVRSAVPGRGEFSCDNELLNRIHRVVRWTEESNLYGVPTDCPQRNERLGWLNDLGARSEEMIYNFDALRLLEKFVTDIADAQDGRTGAIPDTAPFNGGKMPGDPVNVSYLLIPALLQQHYGDSRVVDRHYDGMRRWVAYLTSRAENGIVRYSYWGDWAPPIKEATQSGNWAVSTNTPGDLVSTAFYYYAAKILSEMAETTRRPEEHFKYATLAGEIKTAFNQKYWNEPLGGYGSGNQACNALALYLDLVPPSRRATVLESLVRAVQAADFHPTTGNLCSKYLLEVLSAAGRGEVAVKLATQTTYPSWGFMVENGATTLWERWELHPPSMMKSLNHPMLGSIDSWMYRWVAGLALDPAAGPSPHFVMQPPVLAEITQAKASLPTLWGDAMIDWKRAGDRLTGTVTVPWNCRGTLRLPGAGPQELEAGTHPFAITVPLPADSQ